eukprot:1696438-Rhodomonas_salina.4
MTERACILQHVTYVDTATICRYRCGEERRRVCCTCDSWFVLLPKQSNYQSIKTSSRRALVDRVRGVSESLRGARWSGGCWRVAASCHMPSSALQGQELREEREDGAGSRMLREEEGDVAAIGRLKSTSEGREEPGSGSGGGMKEGGGGGHGYGAGMACGLTAAAAMAGRGHAAALGCPRGPC